jgi:hypothetical protein
MSEELIFKGEQGFIVTLSDSNRRNYHIFCKTCSSVSDFQLRLVGCRAIFEVQSTEKVVPSLEWGIPSTLEKMHVQSGQKREEVDCYISVNEYIVLKSDFVKARTYSSELAISMTLPWMNMTAEQALIEANKRQILQNKKTEEWNREQIEKLIKACKKDYLIEQFLKDNKNKRKWSSMNGEDREKVTANWESYVMPTEIIATIANKLHDAGFEAESNYFIHHSERIADKLHAKSFVKSLGE